MKKLLIIAMLCIGCATPPPSSCHYPKATDMGYREYLRQAQELVKKELPQWYQEDIRVEINIRAKGRYAYVREAFGETVIYVTIEALNLELVEDLALVLLHEYVHTKIWKQLEKEIPNNECNITVQELHANYVVLTDGKVLDYTPFMEGESRFLYQHWYFMGWGYCGTEIMEKFPAPKDIP